MRYSESSGYKIGQVMVIGQRAQGSAWQYSRILLQTTL